jgi:nicotinamidase/pyrazinamidase
MKTAFFDVDTQLDFICRAGALYVPGAEELAPILAGLTNHARMNDIVLLSTADAHAEDDPEFKVWPPHCVAGTFGQQKLGGTLLERRFVLSSLAGTLNRELVSAAQQIVIKKQHVDAFTNPNLLDLLAFIDASRYVLYGVVTDVCVFHAANGLLRTGKRVEIVQDAICASTEAAGNDALNQLVSAGAILTTTDDVLRP